MGKWMTPCPWPESAREVIIFHCLLCSFHLHLSPVFSFVPFLLSLSTLFLLLCFPSAAYLCIPLSLLPLHFLPHSQAWWQSSGICSKSDHLSVFVLLHTVLHVSTASNENWCNQVRRLFREKFLDYKHMAYMIKASHIESLISIAVWNEQLKPQVTLI